MELAGIALEQVAGAYVSPGVGELTARRLAFEALFCVQQTAIEVGVHGAHYAVTTMRNLGVSPMVAEILGPRMSDIVFREPCLEPIL